MNAVAARIAAARTTAAQQGGDFILIRYLQQLTAVYAAEQALHSLFWENMGPNQGGQPTDELADQIAQDFGSFATFKLEVCAAATSLEAGGWVILAWQPKREQLAIRTAESHQLQTEWIGAALLVLDMYEHAYYLKYQNRRAEYAHNWWNTVNWSCVAGRFAALTHAGAPAHRARRSRAPTAKEETSRCIADRH